MLNILVCEDNREQRRKIEKYINNTIEKHGYDCEIIIDTNNPYEIIKYAQNNVDKSNLYFMDVDLKDDIDGIEAAKEIREVDVNGNFIFITGHMEKALLTFKYKLKVLDYIDKLDILNLEDSIEESIKSVYNEVIKKWELSKSNEGVLAIKSGIRMINLPFNEIIYFETLTAHKIKVHTISTSIEFYGSMNEIMEKLNDKLFSRCHKAYIIGNKHIKEFNYKENYVVMDNSSTCMISRKYCKEVAKSNQKIK